MFIPTTPEEIKKKGWKNLDVVIVSGDTYIDSSYNGASVIGHWLIEHGFKVGIICQPVIDSEKDITRLGEPELFWSVTAGSTDSMVANYTPTNKRRKDDDFTPSGVNDRRPDRACIAYANLIKKHIKGKPIVLGGIEASLRRVAHYDFWSDSVRRSILFDSKADIITYGMAELSNLELAERMKDEKDVNGIRGICRIGKEPPEDHIKMPSYEECAGNKDDFIKAFRIFYENSDPIISKGIYQKHGDRYLVQNPPSRNLTPDELDRVYSMDYENAVHPYYLKDGEVKAMETIKNSITSHRGCYGGCSFCAISVHQGRTVVSRSEDSLVSEAERIASAPGFNGIIYDVGGPTANMYGIECSKKLIKGACGDKKCLYPKPCSHLPIDHSRQISLLKRISGIPGVKKVFVASGIRYDMVVSDRISGKEYVDQLVGSHVSGQLKIAPEHSVSHVLELMQKPGPGILIEFKKMFDDSNIRQGKDQFLTYYLMAAHPGCYQEDMEELNRFVHKELRTNPEQVQIFTPTPSTVSTMMYHTRRDYDNTKNLKSEHSMQMKQKQKDALLGPKTVGNDTKRRKTV
ncbi:MAG: YgiQ family radical SAM protein [Methanomassiliicoccaceae archaeon]|nr:YgiQ family radical SAM protein [Methanomassiliicoccaceae archaeon]